MLDCPQPNQTSPKSTSEIVISDVLFGEVEGLKG